MNTVTKSASDRDAQGRFSAGNKLGQGRPKGMPNRATKLAQEALQARSAEIMDKLIEDALGGNETALKLCVERLVPVMKEQPLPAVVLDHDPKAAIRELLARGELTPSELASICQASGIKNLDDDPFRIL